MDRIQNEISRRGTNSGLLDRLVISFDNGLRTVFGQSEGSVRQDPSEKVPEAVLSESESRLCEGLLRVDHAGEVSAQALYQGQALVARSEEVRARLMQSAEEENDHLSWCEARLGALGGHKSFLNPLWYIGSLSTGVIVGLAGDKWSLGFVVETEHQVIRHLDEHLQRLPADDAKSRLILEQMREDEGHHASVALESGAAELPEPIKKMMTLQSKIMTTLAYWV